MLSRRRWYGSAYKKSRTVYDTGKVPVAGTQEYVALFVGLSRTDETCCYTCLQFAMHCSLHAEGNLNLLRTLQMQVQEQVISTPVHMSVPGGLHSPQGIGGFLQPLHWITKVSLLSWVSCINQLLKVNVPIRVGVSRGKCFRKTTSRGYLYFECTSLLLF